MVPHAEPKYFDPPPDDPNDDLRMQPPRNTIAASGRSGGRLLKAPAAALVIGLALPLLLIYWIKTPLPDQHLFFLGVSFTKLALLFWISAAIVAYLAVFALTIKPYYIFGVFLAALFGCFPLVVGLKNDLTLAQTLSDTLFFTGWPFFLKPGYILLQILLPAGMIAYLSLIVKYMFSKQGCIGAYLMAAIYLGLAAFMGIDTLSQVGQPNAMSLFSGAGQPEPPAFENQNSGAVRFPAPAAEIQTVNPPDFSSRIESTPTMVNPAATPSPTPDPLAASAESMPSEPSDIERWQQLEIKLDRILAQLENQLTTPTPQPPPSPSPDHAEHRLADQISALNSKIDQILSRLAGEQIPADKSADATAALTTPAIKPIGAADQNQAIANTMPSSSAPEQIDASPGTGTLNVPPIITHSAAADGIAAGQKPDIVSPPEGPAKNQLSAEFTHLVDKIDRIWQIVISNEPAQALPTETETRGNDGHADDNGKSIQEP